MSGSLILFFDTFAHDGNSKENVDCIRFKTGVQITELRILPFGSAVESNLSDEALLGATNPATFDLSVYSNSQNDCTVLHKVSSHNFNEKNGINSILLKEIQSNFLLFRGAYSVLTIAIFGRPSISLTDQSLRTNTNISVPPPQIPEPIPRSVETNEGAAFAISTDARDSVEPESISPGIQRLPEEVSKLDTGSNWAIDDISCSVSEPVESRLPRISSLETFSSDVKAEETKLVGEDICGLYEDGEIQDIDYEEISSNEELFSEIEDDDVPVEQRQPVDKLDEDDAQFVAGIWRFNPWTMLEQCTTGSSDERLRIPDPTFTLFQVHYWLLDRLDYQSSNNGYRNEVSDDFQPSSERGLSSSNYPSGLLPPPPDDRLEAEKSAKFLMCVKDRFLNGSDASFYSKEWVEVVESIESHLAPGLAFLCHTNAPDFQEVIDTLTVWVYVGLDMSAAFRQTDPTYIIRHLTAGVKLAGLMCGTTFPHLSWSLLHLPGNLDSMQSQNMVPQVQHLLLDLLESSLITTPLRLIICRALDQTTRLSVGLDTFLGRECTQPPAVYPLVEPSKEIKEEDDATRDSVVIVNASDERVTGLPIGVTDITLAADNNSADHCSHSPKPLASISQRLTPYQRLVLICCATENSRVTTSFQRLLNKLHAYELLIDFHDFVTRLKTCNLADDGNNWLETEQTVLQYLAQIRDLYVHASELIANPRSTLPCPMLIDRSKQSPHDPYPDLCSMMDATNTLSNLIWLVQFARGFDDTDITDAVKTAKSDISSSPLPATHDQQMMTLQSIVPAVLDLLRCMLADVNGLMWFASRPDAALSLLRLCLNVHSMDLRDVSDIDSDKESLLLDQSIRTRFLVFGLELAHKLEALRYVDVLIAWVRKKGVWSMVNRISCNTNEGNASLDSKSDPISLTGEPILYQALSRLARLCVSPFGASPRALGLQMSPELNECIISILTSAVPTWMADVLSMDEFLCPILILLEALTTQPVDPDSGSSFTGWTKSKSSTSLKDLQEDESKLGSGGSNMNDSQVQPVGLRTTLRNVLSQPIDWNTLATTLVLTTLRHSEDVTYLDLYGNRLAQLVSSTYNWEDNLDDSVAWSIFTSMQSFSRSAAPFLHWLRDSPARPSLTHLLNLSHSSVNATTPSMESLIWLIGQLKPLSVSLEESLDTLICTETVDELLVRSPQLSLSRKQSLTQNLTATHGHCIPPALLILLRLLRMHVCGQATVFVNSSSNQIPERQVMLSQSLALIELISANGLQLLCNLVKKLSEYFLLQCQSAVVSSGNLSEWTANVFDSTAVSGSNSNTTLVLAMLESAVELITNILNTIIHVHTANDTNGDFRDPGPIISLCQAYACAVYAVYPPGPKADQMKRLREAVVSGLLAYTVCSSDTNSSSGNEKSSWVTMCREVLNFTISSPCYYLPGLLILLDLLPLPLPVTTIYPLDEVNQKQLLASRELWMMHLLILSSDVAGLLELLCATPPTGDNPVYVNIRALFDRLVDLGLPCATLLATSALDSLFAIWDDLQSDLAGTADEQSLFENKPDLEVSDNISASVRTDALAEGDPLLADRCQSTSESLRIPGTKLLLSPPTSSSVLEQTTTLLDDLGCTDAGSDISAPLDEEPSSNKTAPSQSNPDAADIAKLELFSKLDDPNELNAAFTLLLLNLRNPACRFIVLKLLQPLPVSTEDAQPSLPKISKTEEFNTVKPASHQPLVNRRQRFINLVQHVLLPCTDKPAHLNTQMTLLNCVALLLDTNVALNGFMNDSKFSDKRNVKESPDMYLQLFADGLPDTTFCMELILSVIKHINHPDRDMLTLPLSLSPLLSLTEHDRGFVMVKRSLDALLTSDPTSHHFFANIVQRVNDCFSADNPECQSTLAGCLRLLQSLLVKRPTLPLTFTVGVPPGSNEDAVEQIYPHQFNLRRLHISGSRARDLLGWSGSGDEGKPVRDLHALLEMLADDEPSLEYLRSGMKNLLSLLSGELELPECDDYSVHDGQASSETYWDIEPLPKPRTLEQLYTDRPLFVHLLSSNVADKRPVNINCSQFRQEIIKARRCFDRSSSANELIGHGKLVAANKLVSYNLVDLASRYCNGMEIQQELAKCGDSSDVAIRHQKRRRGQNSIIETGRSSKKFVAPMRGRGFVIRDRNAGQTGLSASSGSALNSGSSGGTNAGLLGSSGGARPDLFRSRPLNTSRPPSLHVDDFTKLIKSDAIIEDLPRGRPFRDGRGFRGGASGAGGRVSSRSMTNRRGALLPQNCGQTNAVLPNPVFGLNMQLINPLSSATTSLLPTAAWTSGIRSLLPFNPDQRINQTRRDRTLR